MHKHNRIHPQINPGTDRAAKLKFSLSLPGHCGKYWPCRSTAETPLPRPTSALSPCEGVQDENLSLLLWQSSMLGSGSGSRSGSPEMELFNNAATCFGISLRKEVNTTVGPI